MQTILRIIERAGGFNPGLFLKIENAPYMALVIEAIEPGPSGLPAVSITHYGEQNGDLMRDPEMCFELKDNELSAFYYRNDYVGVEQWEPEHGTRPIRPACRPSRPTSALRQDVGEQPAFAGLRRGLRAAAEPTRLNLFRNGADAGQRVRSTISTPNRSRRADMQNSSAVQFLAIDTIHESTTNPRRTFEESKLHELAQSIRQHGLIQPITVRPNSEGFEIVAGARRFRAAQLAELFAIPARIVEIDDAQAVEWQLVENAMREDVHPYEEAQGFERLLGMPGYDVAALVEKSGKSASHIYARLSLLQLIPSIAEAFSAERITASHANLLARLPQEVQAEAYEQCWRKDWQDSEPHLLPAKHVAAWIQTYLHLSLADAPFDREDPTLNTVAGACSACPRRTGYNTALFPDAVADECLDGNCHQTKINAHIDRALTARPELVQIENGYRSPEEKRAGAVQRGHYREIDPTENPDAEPVPPCGAARPAIIVYGRRLGTILTVCTDDDCPVHDPRAASRRAEHPEPAMPQVPPSETEEEAEARKQQHEQQRKEYEAERERRAEEFRQQQEQEEQEEEAEQARREEQRKARAATFERILENAPETLNAAQLRVLLRAIVNLDPYTFTDDLAEEIVDENDRRTAEEVLLATIDATADDKLTRFAIRLALSGHVAIPNENEFDFLAEADAVFAPPQKKAQTGKTRHVPAAAKPKSQPKKKAAKQQVAA